MQNLDQFISHLGFKKNISEAVNTSQDQRDDSEDKGACHQDGGPEFDPQDPHRGKRELTPTSCPLNVCHGTSVLT